MLYIKSQIIIGVESLDREISCEKAAKLQAEAEEAAHLRSTKTPVVSLPADRAPHSPPPFLFDNSLNTITHIPSDRLLEVLTTCWEVITTINDNNKNAKFATLVK